MKYLIVWVFFLSGCASTPPYDRNAVYDQKSTSLEQEKKQGKIGEVEFSTSMLQLAQRYIPDHPVMVQALNERLELASALERGEISRIEFDAQWKSRSDFYNAKVAKYNADIDEENARRRDQYSRQRAQQPAFNPFAAMLMMNMLNNQINRPSLQPRHCQSYAIGGTVQTDCY
jgi:hypothetical protein